VLLFFASYVPFEVPGSLLVKKVRASRLLPLFMLGWSFTCLGTGFMKTVPQFYASRILMGIFESGMYPALAITLTTFYTPREQGVRFSYLYLSVGLSGAFGGLFAFGLLHLDGRAGLEGWRWLFIVEGIISVGIAVLLWAFMPDNAASAKFLNADDKKLMVLRQEKQARYMALNETFDKKEIWKTFKDPKIWLSGLIQFLGDIMSLGTSTFLPIIIKSFGFPTDHRNPTVDSPNFLVGYRSLYCDFFLVGQNSEESLFHGSRCPVSYRSLLDSSWRSIPSERSSVLRTLFPKPGNLCKPP
jgi:MFS family permease